MCFLYLTDSEGNNLNRLSATIFLFFTTKLFNSSFWALYLKHKYCRDSSAGFSRNTGRLRCFSWWFPGRVVQRRCESERHQRAVNVSFEDLFGWRWFPRIGRCNPSEEWGLGEHPGAKRLRSDCGEVWQLQIFLD